MKILIAVLLGVCVNFFDFEEVVSTSSDPDLFTITSTETYTEKEICTLSITGFGNYEDFGRIKVTVSAEAETCDEAAAEIRAEIIKREIRIEK